MTGFGRWADLTRAGFDFARLACRTFAREASVRMLVTAFVTGDDEPCPVVPMTGAAARPAGCADDVPEPCPVVDD